MMKKTLIASLFLLALTGCSDGQTASRVRNARDVACGVAERVCTVVDRVCTATAGSSQPSSPTD